MPLSGMGVEMPVKFGYTPLRSRTGWTRNEKRTSGEGGV